MCCIWGVFFINLHTVEVLINGQLINIEQNNYKNILEALHENGIFINAYCGGRGMCGKCLVKFEENIPSPSKRELALIPDKKLREGFRLACLHKPIKAKLKVTISQPTFARIEGTPCCDDNKRFCVIDVGTTTISMIFIENREVVNSLNLLNPQIAFGSDVISRITLSNNGKFKTLCMSIQKAVLPKLKEFKPKETIICANPTMVSFFLTMNPKSIGEYPYKPPFIGPKYSVIESLKFYIPPIVSAYLGSDVTAALAILPENEDFILADIGTNCEILLKRGQKYFATSVPAGPALEGAGIDYGTIATDGAIYKVDFNGNLNVYTINNKKPSGITGSGLISTIALMRKFGLIDKTGRIVQQWQTEAPIQLINRLKKRGFLISEDIFLTQNSIRQFQLVKASLNAALELLNKKIGIDRIGKVFIGGGFSKSLTKEELLSSGLLSFGEEFVMLGNSALQGGMKLFCKKERERVEGISKKIKYIEIANEKSFEKLYIEKMNFDE